MGPEVDLVIPFRAFANHTLSKQQIREEAKKAEQQYTRLIDTLTYAGLRAVGRRGESLGHILIFVSCPNDVVSGLVKRERHSDFVSGLPTTPIVADKTPLAPSDRLRLVHAYITSMPADGGLGITPDAPEWDLVESVIVLHDKAFNEEWIHSLTTRNITAVQLEKVKEQFGDSVALYFSFLRTYTRSLILPSVLGLVFYFLNRPYHPLYSFFLLLWSTTFTEYWRTRERILATRFRSKGSHKVEKHRAQHTSGFTWWRRELRMIASIPVILVFGTVLAVLLTAIFVFEAFVTQLYTGPGQKLISFAPTVLFIALIPRFLAVYHSFAGRLTSWENHAHQSSHTASLTIKTFALSALVAYLGLALSAFVYVPFGEGVMRHVQSWVANFTESWAGLLPHLQFINETLGLTSMNMLDANSSSSKGTGTAGIWETDVGSARQRLNPSRLRDQMFAYTVTNQAVNTFMEIGLPFVLRFVERVKSKRSSNSTTGAKASVAPTSGDSVFSASSNSSTLLASPPQKKRVMFEDEREVGGPAEREFLETVREQVRLPEYDVFGDYSEMVTQFGYIVLWSSIWPLAPVMCFINNILEQRSDAFKITVHTRRPIPQRTDTIGPWLDALTFLTWLGALINAALVYLFCPRDVEGCADTHYRNTIISSANSMSSLDRVHKQLVSGGAYDVAATRELLLTALLIALAASHGYMVVRVIIRHVIERVVWIGSKEVKEGERREREVRERFLGGFTMDSEQGKEGGIGVTRDKQSETVGLAESADAGAPGADNVDLSEDAAEDLKIVFWSHDEGPEEINRILKEA